MWWSAAAAKLERATVLDPVAKAVTGAVTVVLPTGPVKDALHGRWLGHQLHPLLVAFPIGMWSGASLLDLSGGRAARRSARRLVGAGLLAAAPTVAAGLADWSELGAFQRPKRVGLVHASANAVTTAVYAASWFARRRGDDARGRNLALLGAGGLVVGGYLGGHLTYSQGVGVNRNADEQVQPREWTDAAALADLEVNTPVRVEVDGQQVVLVRTGTDSVRAIGAICSHYGAPLDEGQLVSVDGEDCLQCPWHASLFRLSDGSVARGPATVPQLGFQVRTVADRVQVRARS